MRAWKLKRGLYFCYKCNKWIQAIKKAKAKAPAPGQTELPFTPF